MKQYIETPQDVLDLLNKAKEEGYPWAQSAIEQFDEEYFNRSLHENTYYNASNALLYAFDWNNSKEGFSYWDEIRGMVGIGFRVKSQNDV